MRIFQSSRSGNVLHKEIGGGIKDQHFSFFCEGEFAILIVKTKSQNKKKMNGEDTVTNLIKI